MQTSTLSARHPSRRKPIAACVAVLFALVAPTAMAATITVANCSDGVPAPNGSLRAAIPLAGEGGTVNFAGLICSTITLEDAQIVIPQQNLTILGPAARVTIAHDGNYDRVFNHQGSGVLALENLNITGGHPYSATHGVFGGCIYSKGGVYLNNSSVTNCFADTPDFSARGGGVYTVGSLTLNHSLISGNFAGSASTDRAAGGGAYAGGFFTAEYSTVRNNVATSFNPSFGGGVQIKNGGIISSSTISGNSAAYTGGLHFEAFQSVNVTIQNSTISGNRAANSVGGAFSNLPTIVRNSTIAFNTAGRGDSNGNFAAPGLDLDSSTSNVYLTLESSILSNNTYSNLSATIDSDISATSLNGTVVVTGSHNLVLASSVGFASGIVTVTGCPLLGPLRDNGGPTQTHALLSHSAAVDQGTNSQHFTYDQRGSPYERADGVAINFADIGAYEVQSEDVVFNSSFESCPTLAQ
jgi:hypothetical protein